MKQEFYNLKISTNGQKLYEFTDHTIKWIKKNKFKDGMLNLSIQHTSASLIVQENAPGLVPMTPVHIPPRLVAASLDTISPG